jgi:F-type H+-transporting ATPase subunit alpha
MNKDSFYKSYNYYLSKTGEIGVTKQILHSVVCVDGLPTVRPFEMVMFETGEVGETWLLDKERVEILLFTPHSIRVGTKVTRMGKRLKIPVGEALLGSTIDPLGRSLVFSQKKKGFEALREVTRWVAPKGIESRARVKRFLTTGVSLVDMLVPLGYGQRELVIGDRKTGKTAFLTQALINQAREGAIGIYGGVAKRQTEIKKMREIFRGEGVEKKIIIVVSRPADSAGLIYLTPFSSMTIAEYFRDCGRDVFLVLDDLSTHATYYRQLSLLARRFPGRDSYPVDIFFTHAGLLERAGNFKLGTKEVAITAMPVAVTVRGDLSGYVQTNLMSMTDGHIFFDSDLFSKGQRPAINPFLSVTRVGRQTQTLLLRQIGQELLPFLATVEKLQHYAHFGAELSPAVKLQLAKGELIWGMFDQRQNVFVPYNIQLLVFGLIKQGLGEEGGVAFVKQKMPKMIESYRQKEDFRKKVDRLVERSASLPEFLDRIAKEGKWFL